MYPAFVDETPIPLSLIPSRWLFNGPDYLEKSWHMRYLTGSDSKNLSTSIQPRQTPTSLEPEILRDITAAEHERHAGVQYRNHGQNLTLSTALQAVEKQKEFTGAAAEEFAHAFTTQTTKLVEGIEAQEERHEALPLQLPLPLK